MEAVVKLAKKNPPPTDVSSDPEVGLTTAVAKERCAPPTERRVLRLPEVMRRVGLSRSTIWRQVRREEFPKPIPLSMNAQGWLEDEVSEWLAEKADRRINRKAGATRR
jgi:prophage regulatory protein